MEMSEYCSRHEVKIKSKPNIFFNLSAERCFKGTVNVVLSDSLCKDGNARFTTVPLKSLPFFAFQKHWRNYQKETFFALKNDTLLHSFEQGTVLLYILYCAVINQH